MRPPRAFSDRTVRNLCIFPVLFLLIAFNIFPLLTSLFISFTEYNPAYQSLDEAKLARRSSRGGLEGARFDNERCSFPPAARRPSGASRMSAVRS